MIEYQIDDDGIDLDDDLNDIESDFLIEQLSPKKIRSNRLKNRYAIEDLLEAKRLRLEDDFEL